MPEIQSVEKRQTAIVTMFEGARASLAQYLGSPKAMSAWAETALTTLRGDIIAKSAPQSVMAAVYKAARLNLPIDGVHFSLMPFWSKRLNAYEIVGAPGYQGYITLYQRHANVTHVHARAVFEGERFELEEGTNERLLHIPNPKVSHTDHEKVVLTYCVGHLRGGGKVWCYVERDRLDKIRERGLAKANGKPSTYDGGESCIEMWKKAAIIRLRKGLSLTDSVAKELAEEEKLEDMEPEEREVETVASRPITTIAALKDSLAPLEPETGAQEAPGSPQPQEAPKVVHGVRITLGVPWEAYMAQPMDRIAKGSPLDGKTPAWLVENSGPDQLMEIKRLVGLGKGQDAPHPTMQKCALVLAQIEPEIHEEAL